MANTYTSLGMHFVTGVKNRETLLQPEWRARLRSMLRERLAKEKHALLSFNTQSDHAHLFVGMYPTQSVSDLAGTWKAVTSSFISEQFGVDFEWQRGYGAFAVSRRNWPEVIAYVDEQDRIHAARSFRLEYTDMLAENEIIYDDKYLFDEVYIG